MWGVPVVFWHTMQEEMLALRGKSKGEYVEAWPLQQKELWGINHVTIYLQARLYWEPELDLEAFLDEYYRTFYGPAGPENVRVLRVCRKRLDAPGIAHDSQR